MGSLIIVTREREKTQSTRSFLYVENTTNLEIFLNENHIPGMALTYVVKNKQNDTDIFIRAYQAFNASWLSRVPLQPQERDIFPNDNHGMLRSSFNVWNHLPSGFLLYKITYNEQPND